MRHAAESGTLVSVNGGGCRLDPQIVDANQRLSRSRLWTLQRAYFESRGLEVWTQGYVPQYVTSNPFVANTYAELILNALRDLQALDFDEDEPVYFSRLGRAPAGLRITSCTRFGCISNHLPCVTFG